MKYIVAVSGGVDSVVLLDFLVSGRWHAEDGTKRKDEFVVAHVDHGIREDSGEDESLVRSLAERYDLPFETTKLQLGPTTSEDTARRARYAWLNEMKLRHQASAIITAHHQDDVIETMIINLLRGTGWRGLCSLRETAKVKRPLLAMPRSVILQYAINNHLAWREDSTNDDLRYLRNYVRCRYVQRMAAEQRRRWIDLYHAQCELADCMDALLNALTDDLDASQWPRYSIIMLDETVSYEVIMKLLGVRLPKLSVMRIRHFVCTARAGKRYLEAGFCFRATPKDVFVSYSGIC